MSIRYDKNLKSKIQRTAKNFNSKVRYNKTKTRNKGMLPQTISAQELMDKYSDKTRAELEKQLKLYQSFGTRSSLNKAGETSRISSWELKYFKTNYDKTLEFYEKEIKNLQRIIGDKPEYFMAQHTRLQTLLDKKNFLQKDLRTLTEDEIKIMRNVFGYAERSELVKRKSFRNYLSQLDRLLEIRKVPRSKRNELLNKFDVLSENEFTEMVRNEDLIQRVYELVYSPEKRGDYELTVDERQADEIITAIWSSVDDIISKYKTNS